MIERTYGWGSGAVSMPRPKPRAGRPLQLPRTRFGADMVRHVLYDVPWRTLAGSFFLTVAGLLTLFALHTRLPVLTRDAAPVPIAVRFLEAPADPTPPRTAERPKSPPIPASEKPPPIRVPTEPERPLPLVVEVEPSQPASTSMMEEAPRPPSVAEVRPAEGKKIELGPLPDLAPPSQRAGKDELPASGSVTFASSTGRDPVLSKTELSSERFSDRRSEAKISEPVRREKIDLQWTSKTGALPVPGLSSFDERSATETPVPGSKAVFRRVTTAEVEVIPPTSSSKSGHGPAKSAAPPPVTNGAPFEFFERESPPALDRTRLLSLTELRTCLDPLAENELRTRLATLLSRPGTCRSDGVFFDFHQPESAWSIRVDIYNYEGATFRDRCSALQRAVECSEHGRRNPQ